MSSVSDKGPHPCGSGLQLATGLNGSATQAMPKEMRIDLMT